MQITRKATGKVTARDVRPEQIELILSAFPRGVYGVESDTGIEVAVAIVYNGRVSISG